MSEIGRKIIAEAIRVAEENPDFVYRPPDGKHCVYVYDGKPSCLIGHALWNLGLIGPEFERATVGVRRFDNFHKLNNEDVGFVINQLCLDLDEDEVTLLSRMQDGQDDENPWGEVLLRTAPAAGAGE